MKKEQIINKAIDYYSHGGNVFSLDICEAIDKLPHHDRIHTLVNVIKKIHVSSDSYILLGKLNDSFDWITDDDINKILERVKL